MKDMNLTELEKLQNGEQHHVSRGNKGGKSLYIIKCGLCNCRLRLRGVRPGIPIIGQCNNGHTLVYTYDESKTFRWKIVTD